MYRYIYCTCRCSCTCRRHSFCSFSHEKTQSGTRTFHDICCSNLPKWFQVFFALVSVSSKFAAVKPFLMCKNRCSLTAARVLETATRSKKHEAIVEGHRLRTANTLSTAQDSTAHDSTPQRNPHLLLFFSLLSSLIPFNPLFHARKMTIIISGKYCQEINMVA